MHQLVVVVALLPGGALPPEQPSLPGQSLSRLIAGLEESGKSPADQLDALFFAMHGRFATAHEHWLVKHKYGCKLTPEAHIELRWAAGAVSPFDTRRPWYSLHGSPKGAIAGLHGFGLGMSLGYPPSVPLYGGWVLGAGLVPNPLALPPTPWIPPGSSVPLPRLGR